MIERDSYIYLAIRLPENNSSDLIGILENHKKYEKDHPFAMNALPDTINVPPFYREKEEQ